METNTTRLLLKLQTIITPWAYSLSNLGDFVNSFSFNEGAALILTLTLAIGVLFLEHLAVWKESLNTNYYFILVYPLYY